MAIYVSSDQIKVYPSAYRSSCDPGSRLNSEFNITRTTGRLTAFKPAYVSSGDFGEASLEFCLGGYWFEVSANPSASGLKDLIDKIVAANPSAKNI